MTHNTTPPPPSPNPMIIIQKLKYNKFVKSFKFKDENKEDKVGLFDRYYTQKK